MNRSTLHDFLRTEGPDRRAVLADLDGCLIAGGRLLPGAAELLARCGTRLWIISNNSADTAETLARRLAGLGLPLAPDRLLLAGELTLRRALAALPPGAGVDLLAEAPLRDLARQLGVDPRAPAALAFLGRWTGFGFNDLVRLAGAVSRGLPLLVANPDTSHPDRDGHPVPETGALHAALAATLGPGWRATPLPEGVASCGKPRPALLELALDRAGVAPRDAIMIGDNPDTDGAAAITAGIAFHLVARPGPASGGARC